MTKKPCPHKDWPGDRTVRCSCGAVRAHLIYIGAVVGLMVGLALVAGAVGAIGGLVSHHPAAAPPTPAQRCNTLLANTDADWISVRAVGDTVWCYVPTAGEWMRAS